MNYYDILQIKPHASNTEIKQAYRRLVKKYHPDSQTDTANHEDIIKINLAYEVLGDQNRRVNYDQQLTNHRNQAVNYRHQKSYHATRYYHGGGRSCEDQHHEAWFSEVYYPLLNLIAKIINPLDDEIEELSADPFDDDLMLQFMEYIGRCHEYYQQGRQILKSQPNPRHCAGTAANLYYCLNHLSDGIEDLERFTLNYEESYLHTGRELFILAQEIIS